MNPGARLNDRRAQQGTPLPPPIEFHTVTTHHVGANARTPAPPREFEPDPPWFTPMWAIAVAAAAIACIFWPHGSTP